MTVLFHVDWQYGEISGSTYTMAAPEIPDGNADCVLTGNPPIIVESASPWNGQSLLDCSGSWDDGAEWNALTSAHVPATTGRMLIETEPMQPADITTHFKLVHAAQENLFRLMAWRIDDTTDYLQVQFSWDSWNSQYEVRFSSYPTNPFALEIIYDATNATASQRLRARWWNIGSSPGSFVNQNAGSGSAVATSQPTLLSLEEPGNGDGRSRYGRIIISDDIAEDLSTWTPSGGGIALPRHHRSTLLRM